MKPTNSQTLENESSQLKTKTTTGSINTTNTSDISNPIKKSENYKLIAPSFNNNNNSVNDEDDSSKIKRFNYESSHESESEESAVLHNFRVSCSLHFYLYEFSLKGSIVFV